MEFQLSWNPKRWCCESAALNMPGNLENSAVATGLKKGQFSFQSQRRAVPRNVQTATQLYSFHILAKSCSKSFKLAFNSTWAYNFQIYNLGITDVEEPDFKLPTYIGSWRQQGSSRKATTLASYTMLKPLCGSQQTVENSWRDGSTRPSYLSPEKPVCWSRSNS